MNQSSIDGTIALQVAKRVTTLPLQLQLHLPDALSPVSLVVIVRGSRPGHLKSVGSIPTQVYSGIVQCLCMEQGPLRPTENY